MKNQLMQFDIIGLHGIRDYSIRIEDNRLIIVGENGSGKTTIFKIMYHTLACDWDALRIFDFEKVVLWFRNVETSEKIEISSELLQSIFAINNIDRLTYYMDSRNRSRHMNFEVSINDVVWIKKEMEEKNSEELDRFYMSSSIPYKYIQDIYNEKPIIQLLEITQKIEKWFDVIILYLPTYRRIEEQLKNIFPNKDSDDWNRARRRRRSDRAIELVEFGMGDVEKAVKLYQERLNEFSRAKQNKLTLGYLSEIISEKYENVDVDNIRNLTEQQISDILQRIDTSILSDSQKTEIIKILFQIKDTLEPPSRVREKIICHYFLKLIDFDKGMSEEEVCMFKFRDKCNKYLVSNGLKYDSKDFSCKVYNKVAGELCESQEIQFQNMSSGEKQIVSLFSQLNLVQKSRLFVFIDEPELSLSVDWQRMFLVDILDSTNCVGVIATTHSPFIFDNELEEYVHGINEFCTRG